MKFSPTLLCLFLGALTGWAEEPIALWPNGVPGGARAPGQEQDLTKPTDKGPGGRPIIRLGNVSDPSITLFRPAKEKETGTAVVVCPGGGYHILAWDLEGSEICQWLNSIGVTGVLLKYRVPTLPGQERVTAPLQDAQRALALVRSKAALWNVNPERIGILGFSAGGHLSAAASTHGEARTYPEVDAADKASCRADFAVLVYPAYLSVKEQGDKVAPELPVDGKTSPTFIVMTEDDPLRPESALAYYAALKNAKVPAEMHLYPKGGHGYGLRPSPNAVSNWPSLVEVWMRGLGVLPALSK